MKFEKLYDSFSCSERSAHHVYNIRLTKQIRKTQRWFLATEHLIRSTFYESMISSVKPPLRQGQVSRPLLGTICTKSTVSLQGSTLLSDHQFVDDKQVSEVVPLEEWIIPARLNP